MYKVVDETDFLFMLTVKYREKTLVAKYSWHYRGKIISKKILVLKVSNSCCM